MAPRRRIRRGSPAGSESDTAEPQLVSHPGNVGLLALPPELLEDILVLLAELGHPKTISALAKTCRTLRQLIYAPQDKFLWRRMLLATFDDPRSIQVEPGFNWASDYQARVEATLFIEYRRRSAGKQTSIEVRRYSPRSSTKVASATSRAKRRASHSSDAVATSGADYTVALQTLLSILDTSCPVSKPTRDSEKQPWENPNLIALSLREASVRAPPFPPYLTTVLPEVLDAASTTATDGKSDAGSVDLPPIVRPSKNLAYIKRLLSSDVVPDFVSYLTTPATSERRSPWQSTPEARALNRLVSTFGISAFLQTPRRDWTRGRQEDENDTVHRKAIYPNADQNTALAELFNSIRHASQKKVYDMNYLSRKRAWGPFLRVHSDKSERQDAMSASSSDDEDGEYHHIPEQTPSDSEASQSDSEEDGEDEENQDYVPPHQRNTEPKPLPQPEDLQADWEHLAAIRIVVQAKLEEKLNMLQTDAGQWFEPGQVEEILKTLLGWENVRSCVWTGAQAKRKTKQEEGSNSQRQATKISNSTGISGSSGQAASLLRSPSEPLTEWDWAGVEGVWRRCVCWLDYHDLIYNNWRGFQSMDDLEEATITVPLALHITGFSPSTIPEYKDFPTIHFDSRRYPTIHMEGTMGGAEWAYNGGAQEDVRHIKGSVRVCSDGSVWWSMLSSVQGSPTEWEWSSEGIQIGAALGTGGPIGVRSGCGVLGLWTGWEHEAEDPIGAWWQWKVA
ncbi:uncharacterized protein PHACADRAFT_204731 [Phanerochaete carnosa HHB-10118-sp]|uniref:F-box domain-containing protein n=1 Tax=Phanerochaete carnosa (strain HHB-10118-sp) TaxID=650164 RepID=K5WQ05_PHACS|nr:uncharacterized protein PHACADRAFT_204731 [Phanerochaete carnosa HHB-10118-sp]EKM61560.1 hypothetical protein PHACADRAFT_204731 [Phanerochaete carnosa HHB-10118-sp]